MFAKTIPVFTPSPRVIDEATKLSYSQIYFRQSFIQDYLVCPYMAMSRWLGSAEERQSYLAAYLGTAGHEVIYRIHQERRLDVDRLWLAEAFESAFLSAIQKEPDRVPTPKPGYDTIMDQFQAEMPFYVELLKNYQLHPRTKEFHSTIHEQSFVLQIPNHDPSQPAYLFTGTIDQAGFENSGSFLLRDIKFRDTAFKYSRRELDLNVQMTVYSAALKYGHPSCDACKPRYELSDPTQGNGEDDPSCIGMAYQRCVYNGPCEACKAKIGTPQWPVMLPERCEMVWMFDLEPRKTNEHPEFITRKDLPKVTNPATGRKVYREEPNPEFSTGKKIGDPKGDCFLRTYRPSSRIQAFLEDILRVCDQIRNGVFFRLPSKNCNWCTQYDICQGGVKADEAVQTQKAAALYGSHDPFGGV